MGTDLLKCVVVGDGAVGKTCLLMTYAKKEYPINYVPTIFDSYTVSVPIQNEMYDIYLFDTAGQEDYDQLRQLAFPNTDVLIVCFSIDFKTSFDNVRDLWIPEVQKYCPGVPFILVGTKMDKRDRGGILITQQQGERLARELGAVKYLECSALTNRNVDDVFQEAILVALSAGYEEDSSQKSGRKVNDEVTNYRNYNTNTNTSNTNDTEHNTEQCKFCSCHKLCTIL